MASRALFDALLSEQRDDQQTLDESASAYSVWSDAKRGIFLDFISRRKFRRALEYLADLGRIQPRTARERPARRMQTVSAEGVGALRELLSGNEYLISQTDLHQMTLLHYAAEFEDPSFATLLLRYGAEPNRRDGYGCSPLVVAIRRSSDSTRTLACLLDHGADVNDRFRYDITPLMMAVEKNYREKCVVLIEAGADVRLEDNEYRIPRSALYFAVSHKEPRCLAPLLDAGASSSVEIIRAAVRYGRPQGLNMLLRVPPATDANFSLRPLIDELSQYYDGSEDLRWLRPDRNLAYLERVVAAGNIFLYERDQQRALVSLLRRHVAPDAPDDVLHVIVSFWGHPGGYFASVLPIREQMTVRVLMLPHLDRYMLGSFTHRNEHDEWESDSPPDSGSDVESEDEWEDDDSD